jgi:hypothetical protein
MPFPQLGNIFEIYFILSRSFIAVGKFMLSLEFDNCALVHIDLLVATVLAPLVLSENGSEIF